MATKNPRFRGGLYGNNTNILGKITVATHRSGSTWLLSQTAAFRYSTIVEKKKAGKAKDFYGLDSLFTTLKGKQLQQIQSLRCLLS